MKMPVLFLMPFWFYYQQLLFYCNKVKTEPTKGS